jgi:hypothetical protein
MMGFLTPIVEHCGLRRQALRPSCLEASAFRRRKKPFSMLAGYLVRRGDLSLPLVVAVGVVSASLGDYILLRRASHPKP